LYAESFGVTNAAIGLTIAVYGLARFIVNMPAGALADHKGRRWTLAIGGIVTVLGNLLCAAAWDYTVFLVGRFIAGAGAAMVLTGGQIVVADIASPANRGRLMAIYQGVFLFAVGAGPLPGGIIAERFSLEAPFVVNAAMAGIVAVLAWWAVPETRDLGQTHGAVRVARPSPRVQLQVLTATPGFLLISIVSFVAFFVRTGALFNVIPIVAEDEMGLGPGAIGLGLGMISIVGLVLAYPSGMLVDRFGRKAVIVPAAFLTGAASLLYAAAPGFAWFLVASAVWSTASGIGGAAPAAYAADTAPAGMMAAALGTYRMISDFGYVVGPLVLGIVADVGTPDSALVLCAVMLFASGLMFARFAPETLPSRANASEPELV
ncbi:MAG TPA: MFS transporter, partial [Thermomicrobiales bacterium]|nr:MFS transporter [Thermomicrobiales bacterium]